MISFLLSIKWQIIITLVFAGLTLSKSYVPTRLTWVQLVIMILFAIYCAVSFINEFSWLWGLLRIAFLIVLYILVQELIVRLKA
jgi:hypothetical protein